MKHAIAAILFLSLFAAIPAAAQDGPARPKPNEVVFVIKVRVQPAIPEAFFAQYSETRKGSALGTVAYLSLSARNASWGGPTSLVGPLNRFGYIKQKMPKDGAFSLHDLRVCILDNSYFSLTLPIGMEFTVAEGTRFVYLGTFVFTYSDEYFTPVSLTRVDEFDDALAELKAALGPDARLVRAAMVDAAP